MADCNGSGSASSTHLLRSTGNEIDYVCKSCKDRESQLKEALDELSSAQTIITILQNELQTYRASAATCEVNLTIAEEAHNKPRTDEWTATTYRSNNVKLRERRNYKNSEIASPGPYISTENRFSSLANLERKESASLQRATNPVKQQPRGRKIPKIVNGTLDYYKDFPSLIRKQEKTIRTSPEHQIKKRAPQPVESESSTTHKVLIIGDSHARNCVNLLQDNLSSDFKVTSFVKPGANMKEIVNTVSNEIKTLQGDDLVVVWGGANDIRKNNMREAIKSVSKFVNTNQDINIVLINSPRRYDLMPESCVNNEVNTYNRQVKKIMKQQPQVKILELILDRHHFTSHGLHLNYKGKKVVSQNLALVVKQFFKEVKKSPISVSIPISWKDPPLHVTTAETQKIQDTNETKEANNPPPPIYHRRYCPTRRDQDFLWM